MCVCVCGGGGGRWRGVADRYIMKYTNGLSDSTGPTAATTLGSVLASPSQLWGTTRRMS